MRVSEETIRNLLRDQKLSDEFVSNSIDRIFGTLTAENASKNGFSDITILERIEMALMSLNKMTDEEISTFMKKVEIFMSL